MQKIINLLTRPSTNIVPLPIERDMCQLYCEAKESFWAMVNESLLDDVVPFERMEEEEDMFTRLCSDHHEGESISITSRSILGMRLRRPKRYGQTPFCIKSAESPTIQCLVIEGFGNFWSFEQNVEGWGEEDP